VEKAYNAEKAGAKAILVMDDREEQLLTMAAPEDHPEIAKLREDITIPTALIRRVNFTTPTPPPLPLLPPAGILSQEFFAKVYVAIFALCRPGLWIPRRGGGGVMTVTYLHVIQSNWYDRC